MYKKKRVRTYSSFNGRNYEERLLMYRLIINYYYKYVYILKKKLYIKGCNL